MSTPRFARGSKSRLFLYIGAITAAGVVVYFFHRAQVDLYDLQRKSEKCVQQQESLSAQFQVIIEYKIRLEKSLQQEKIEHHRLRKELQEKLDEEKKLREKEDLENNSKYSSLQQQYKILQSHHEDLTEECGRLRVSQLQGLDARSKLESALEASKQEIKNVQQAMDKEMANLKNRYLELEVENDKLRKQNKELTENGREHNSNMNHLEKEVIQLNNALQDTQERLSRCEAHSSSPVQMVGNGMAVGAGVGSAPKASSVPKPSSSPVAVAPNLNAQVLAEPQHEHLPVEKVLHTSLKSTTPQINPDAVLSREKAVQAAPIAMAVPDTFGKEPTPFGAAGSSRKEVASVGAAPPLAAAAAGGDSAGGGVGGEADGEGMAAGGGVGGGESEGALQAPNWEPPNDIPNQAPFPAPGGGLVRGAIGGAGAAGPDDPNGPAGVGPAPPVPDARRPHVPAGVVPAPRGYGLDRDPREEAAAVHGAIQEGAIGQDNWHWRRSKAWAAPAIGAMVEPLRRRQLAEPRRVGDHGIPGHMAGADGGDEGEEREKENPRQLHPYGEYNGDNGEYEKERHGDLQLEEEEEEEDDDVDQIDYANDNANGAEARQKRLNLKESVPNVNIHESVMVNPK